MQILDRVVRELTPPAILKLARRFFGIRSESRVLSPPPASSQPTTMFSGDYPSFADAAAASVGYDDEAPATSAVNQLRRLLEFEQPDEIHGLYQQVHSAICIARDHLQKDSLSVLDIGGGSGSYFFRLRGLMPATKLKWHVVETPSIVRACAAVAGPYLTYSEQIPSDGKYDVALISGTLQYLDQPFEILEQAGHSAIWIIVTRLPTHRHRTKVMVQTVPDDIHRGSMPIQIFCIDDITAALKKIGKIQLSWAVTLEDPAFVGMDVSNFGYLVRSAAN